MSMICGRITAPLLALSLCLSLPAAALSASMNNSAGSMPFGGDPAKADAKKQSESKSKFDAMNKGADMMVDGADMMMKKDKQAMAEGQKMMTKGHGMMRSSGLKDKGSMKMMGGADMMLKAAEMMMSGSESEGKQGASMMTDGEYILLQGKGMLMDSAK